MKQIIMTIGILAGVSCQPDGTRVDYTEKLKLAESINHIQDMKEWMKSDVDNDNIITDLGEFYIENLGVVEDILIEIYNTNQIRIKLDNNNIK